MSQTKEGTHNYYFFFFFSSWWLIFFLCADSWTVWNCNLNVLIFLVSDLSADWHHFFSIYFNLHPTLCLTWEDTHAVICQNVFDIEETNVFMGQYSMVYYLLILFVYLVSQLMMGMIRWCFYQNPESAMFKRFQSCWLYLTFSFSMLSVCTFPPEVYIFSPYCYMWRSELSPWMQPTRRLTLERFRLNYC